MRIILLFTFLLSCFPIDTKETSVESSFDPDKVSLTAMEADLARKINAYRSKQGLNKVPVSKSMTYVSQQHVKEMQYKLKKLTHSWVGCNYDGPKPKAYECMWSKPEELTGYAGKGYECAYYYSGDMSADIALKAWAESRSHREVITNKGIWKNMDWNAMGVAIHGNYAAVWFGTETDKHGSPGVRK